MNQETPSKTNNSQKSNPVTDLRNAKEVNRLRQAKANQTLSPEELEQAFTQVYSQQQTEEERLLCDQIGEELGIADRGAGELDSSKFVLRG